MTIESILHHIQDNAAAVSVVGILFLILTVVFRKFMLPLLYHTGEYIVYCTLAHTFLAGFVRAFSWFREETEFKNFKGETLDTFKPYTTPMNLNFWQHSLYNPTWLFWLEAVIAAGLLYIVVVIRPTRMRRNTYKSKRPAPGAISGNTKAYAGIPRKDGRKMKAAR